MVYEYVLSDGQKDTIKHLNDLLDLINLQYKKMADEAARPWRVDEIKRQCMLDPERARLTSMIVDVYSISPARRIIMSRDEAKEIGFQHEL